ncbi:MAG: 2-C-methyl-D-erythritol 2,4-cyclodiphosphate synthase, partial [Flavobacteriales bacterium]
LHAICDALLGAASLGDIGSHFPDNKKKYKGIDSKILLKEVKELITKEGFHIENIDSVICIEKPKLSSQISNMKMSIAKVLDISPNNTSVKATTHENTGPVGRGEAMEAHAIALISKEA